MCSQLDPFHVQVHLRGKTGQLCSVREKTLGFTAPILYSDGSSGDQWCRIGLLLPFADRATIFMLSDVNNCEKNWVVFSLTDTHIEMLRAFFPLRVASCHLSSGACTRAYQGLDNPTIGPMRPGTTLIEIKPNLFFWIGANTS
jgi:hypothetical protein